MIGMEGGGYFYVFNAGKDILGFCNFFILELFRLYG